MENLIWFIFIFIFILSSIVIVSINNKNTCYKNCSNKGKCINGVCKCDKNYRGNYCSIKCPSSCVSPYGTCDLRGNCVCSPGYGGDNCRAHCKNNCNYQGICQADKTCKCFPGYLGENCDITCPDCNTPDGGKCVLNDGSKPVCECNPGYLGENCIRDYIQISSYKLNGTQVKTFTGTNAFKDAKDFCRKNKYQGINSIPGGSASVINGATEINNVYPDTTYASIIPSSNGKYIFTGFFDLKGTKINTKIFKDFNKILPYFQDNKDAEGYTCLTKLDPSGSVDHYVVDFFKNITEMKPHKPVNVLLFMSIKWG